MTMFIELIIFAALGGIVGAVALDLAGSKKSFGDRFAPGVPLGVLGLIVGQILFTGIFHLGGLKPVNNAVSLSNGTASGGGLNLGHIAWDVFVGLAGCAAVAIPIVVLAGLAGAFKGVAQSHR